MGLIYAGPGYLTAQAAVNNQLPRATPETQGVSSAGILAFLEAIAKSKHEFHSFILVRHGQVIAEGWWAPYRADLNHMLYSMSKSFTSTAIGFTVGLCLSQAIYVQIDIERNTCMTAEFLRQMLITQASSAAESPLPVATQPPAPPLSPAATPFAPPPSYTGSAPTITSPTPTQQP